MLRWVLERNGSSKDALAPAQALSTCLRNVPDSPVDPQLPTDLAYSVDLSSSRAALISLLDYLDTTVNSHTDVSTTDASPTFGRELVTQTAIMVGTTVLTHVILSALGGKS